MSSALLSGLMSMACMSAALAQEANTVVSEELPNRLVGDVGVGMYQSPSEIHDKRTANYTLPYVYADYGRFFSRIDTIGFKTFKMGYGYFELAKQINFDGFKASNAPYLHGLQNRKDANPLGVGTYQETPVGAFFLNAFYDANKSHGTLLEAIYAGEIKAGSISFYPQIGAEYRNANYVNYFYGVTQAESAANGHIKPWQGGSAINPLVALQIEIPLNDKWVVNLYGRYKWFGQSIRNSPLVDRDGLQLCFVSLAYRFK
ncbi:MipA/OmpV family protein [Glaciimonas sp. GG7]